MSADLLVSESAYLIYAPACGLVVEAVTQWRDEIRPQSALLIFSSAPQVVLFTDALMAGWGDHVVHLVAADSWSVQKPMLHTYVLEWEAVCRSVSLLASFLKGKSVRLLSDNTSVACYVSKLGGARSEDLSLKAMGLLLRCLFQIFHLTARYVLGELYVLTDSLSRSLIFLPSE